MTTETAKLDERDLFEMFVHKIGQIRSRHVVMCPDEFLADDGDCWTAAWTFARATGGTYVEGCCILPPDPELGDKKRKVRAHAWVERQGPFGLQVVECTRGYENGSSYKGVPVNSTEGGEIDQSTSTWGNTRASVIEVFFHEGFDGQQILAAIK